MSQSNFWDALTEEEAKKQLRSHFEEDDAGPVEKEIIVECVRIDEDCEFLRKPPAEIRHLIQHWH